MNKDRASLAASVIVFWTGAFWGVYWLPVRALEDMGLTGAWGTAAIAAAAVILLSPFVVLRRKLVRDANPVALVSIALGGAAFALYSVGFIYGRVAIIILLYFLTPVWSTLIGLYIMGWQTPRMRVLAIAIGLLGLCVMLSATGELPLPRNAGEWMALLAGLLWSVATTGMRAKSGLAPIEAAFVFAGGASVAALLLAPFLEPLPAAASLGGIAEMLGLTFVTGGIWWALSVASLMWATVRLEPARVGILLMTEVLVGAASAALFANEHLHALEIVGGALVLLAGVLEVLPQKTPRAPETKTD